MPFHPSILAIGVFLGSTGLSHAQPASNCPEQISLIPPPDDKQITVIRDAADWTNPYVLVSGGDYELILHDRPRTTKRLSMAELRQSLIELPAHEWPLGRVVGIQENALASDRTAVKNRLAALKALLKGLCLRSDQWPTA